MISEALLEVYLNRARRALDLAGPTEDEALLEARRELHSAYREQAAAGAIDLRLREFFCLASRLMLRKEDVAEGWRQFFERKAHAGAPPKLEYENFQLAIEVDRLMRDGMTRDKACEIVAERHPERSVSADAVRNLRQRADEQAREVQEKIDELGRLTSESPDVQRELQERFDERMKDV